jgi:hypothetical protein
MTFSAAIVSEFSQPAHRAGQELAYTSVPSPEACWALRLVRTQPLEPEGAFARGPPAPPLHQTAQRAS